MTKAEEILAAIGITAGNTVLRINPKTYQELVKKVEWCMAVKKTEEVTTERKPTPKPKPVVKKKVVVKSILKPKKKKA